MQRMSITSPLVAIAFLVSTTTVLSVGCSRVREEVRQATGQVEPTWREQRDDFIRKTNNRLDDVASTVNQLNTKNFASNKKQRAAREHVSEIQDLMAEVRAELRKLQDAGPENWTDQRSEVRTSLNKLESEYLEAEKMLE